MKLAQKLFISYAIVVLVGLVVLTIATSFVAPASFSERMLHMRGNGTGMMMGEHLTELDEEVDASFRAAVNIALAISGIAAIAAALGVSWFVSQQITRPIRSLVALSQQIAGGSYQQRLRLDSRDELAELVENFNRMAEALQTTEAQRIRLLGDVTHELKTPLAGIKGYMEGLQDGVLPATPETFQLIHREADRLQRLVLDLQELSRTESGQIALDLQPQTLEAILLPVVERMRPQFSEKSLMLRLDLPADLPSVCADGDRTAQVLTNLLGNALQYTLDGGTVTLAAAAQRDCVRVSVTDTGIGIAAAELPHVFQRFYRVDKSRSRGSGGSGIGLTVAKYWVEAQGGTIHAHSDGTARGSCFSFTLPLA